MAKKWDYDHAAMAEKDTLRALETATSISEKFSDFTSIVKKDLNFIAELLQNKKYSEALEAARKLDDFIPPPETHEDKNMASLRSDVIEIVWEIEDCMDMPDQTDNVVVQSAGLS